ncbi:MAG: hypothetical protein N2Z21_03395 [Candidatus Sumerlaeaceae bacterium]|nr:hypothetical protein [Candidatus Sumerlaeaceae bacterium]
MIFKHGQVSGQPVVSHESSTEKRAEGVSLGNTSIALSSSRIPTVVYSPESHAHTG